MPRATPDARIANQPPKARWYQGMVRPGTLGDRRSTWVRISWAYQQLLEAKCPVTARQLADRWETSTKSINRDIEALRMAGLDIATQNDGRGFGTGYTLVTKMCPMCHEEQGSNNQAHPTAAAKGIK